MPDRNRIYHGVSLGILMLDTRFERFNGGIRFVARYLAHLEPLRRGVDQRRELWAISRISVQNLSGSNHIRFDTATNVRLDPHGLAARRAVLLVNPGLETVAAEAAAGSGGNCSKIGQVRGSDSIIADVLSKSAFDADVQ